MSNKPKRKSAPKAPEERTQSTEADMPSAAKERFKRKAFNVRVGIPLWEELERASTYSGSSVNALVCMALMQFLGLEKKGERDAGSGQ